MRLAGTLREATKRLVCERWNFWICTARTQVIGPTAYKRREDSQTPQHTSPQASNSNHMCFSCLISLSGFPLSSRKKSRPLGIVYPSGSILPYLFGINLDISTSFLLHCGYTQSSIKASDSFSPPLLLAGTMFSVYISLMTT